MPRIQNKPYALKDRTEKVIDNYAGKKTPTQSELNLVMVVAQAEARLEEYSLKADDMSKNELEDEKHQSARLAEFMITSGKAKPHSKCHAHAIISGAHKNAAELRATIAWLKMRIDDPDNGCWLPENTAAKPKMPKHLKNAVPHSRIHRYNYYFWLKQVINPVRIKEQAKLRRALDMIATRLQAGNPAPYVMNKKGVGLPR